MYLHPCSDLFKLVFMMPFATKEKNTKPPIYVDKCVYYTYVDVYNKPVRFWIDMQL